MLNRFSHNPLLVGLGLFILSIIIGSQPSGANAYAQEEALLTIHFGNKVQTYSLEDLLHNRHAVSLELSDRSAYSGSKLKVTAIAIAHLFEGIKVSPGDTIEFDTTDGFSSSLNPDRLLNTDPQKAIAYLAVEDPRNPWPRLGKSSQSAGPLYLVWINPEASKISQEEWPYQLHSFTVQEPIEKRFPAIVPAASLASDAPERNGYQVFLKNCFACHTLNGEGNSKIGPDLNVPHSPTEYFRDDYLKTFIRDPQELRHWPKAKMKGFSEESLSKVDLSELIIYLKHMAKRR